MEEEAVLYAVEDGIATITLNRPDRLNAVNYALMVGFLDAVQKAAADDEVGCVIVTGAGRGFCAGGDRKDGGTPPANADGTVPPRPEGLTTEGSRLLRDMPKPTIAMVNGPAAGAGIGIAGSCDLRFAAKSATFYSAFDNIGASGDYGASFTWTRALGAAKAREIFLLGEKFTAEEALAFGIYTRVYADDELKEKTYAVARRFVDGPRPAWGFMKANMNAAEQMTYGEQILLEGKNMGASVQASFRHMRAKAKAAEAAKAAETAKT